MGDGHHRHHLRRLRARVPARHRGRARRVVGEAPLKTAWFARASWLVPALAVIALPVLAAPGLICRGRVPRRRTQRRLRARVRVRICAWPGPSQRAGAPARSCSGASAARASRSSLTTTSARVARSRSGTRHRRAGDAPRKSEATYVDDRFTAKSGRGIRTAGREPIFATSVASSSTARLDEGGRTAFGRAARELAARDHVTDEQFYATLEALVADHRPKCE